MSYATLMVNVDVERDCNGRVSVAAGLAELFNAHLIGIAGWAPMSLFLAKDEPADPTPTQQDMKTLLDQKGEQFRAAVSARGRRAEWRSVLELPTEAVAREARAADLVIVGQDRDADDPFRALDPGSLILKVGRPVLVVPKRVTSLPLKRVAIAWKDMREARRAVRDALPLLEAGDGSLHRLKDVAGYLKRHGIEIIAERVRPLEIGAADALLALVYDENINLIVAGAYGHSRLGEWVFGGVTRDLLEGSPVCCLFSH
jgi:nucleotide-binding universal stress UspA family protein